MDIGVRPAEIGHARRSPHWRRGILNAYQERALPRAAATAVV